MGQIPVEKVVLKSRSTNVSEIQFYLWTLQNPGDDEFEILEMDDPDSVTSSYFDPNKITKFLIHGWGSSPTSSWVLQSRDAYFSLGEKL